MAVLDRIALQRSVAVVTEDSIVVRPARGRLVAPLLQGLLAGAAVVLLVPLLNGGAPLLLLALLLATALLLGPAAVLGLVYNVAGSTVSIERRKQSVRLQQGFLGLGLGTAEMAPFWRIDRVEVAGDYERELSSGQLPELVRWDVRVVKDNGRVLEIGAVVVARPLAAEALERANRLAHAVARLTGVEARTAELPAGAPSPAGDPSEGGIAPRRRRLVRRQRRPAPPAPDAGAGRSEGVAMDRAMELMRDATTIAVVGVSPQPDRDSHEVARYLIEAGYNVYLVNPREQRILDRTVYGRVQDLPEPVDIVDIFRRPADVPPVVDDAIAAGAKAVWMQLGVVNEEAAERARAAGLEVVMDRCTKVEHMRLPGSRRGDG